MTGIASTLARIVIIFHSFAGAISFPGTIRVMLELWIGQGDY
jgi:hypothetical protein